MLAHSRADALFGLRMMRGRAVRFNTASVLRAALPMTCWFAGVRLLGTPYAVDERCSRDEGIDTCR